MAKNNEIDLMELWQIVNGNKKYIFKITAIVMFLSLLLAIFSPQVYRGNVMFVSIETGGAA